MTLAKAMRLKSQKYYRNRHGELFPVVVLEKHSPHWRVVLADGRDFLIDPKTPLEVKVR